MRTAPFLATVVLLLSVGPVVTQAASKEQMEMQRDIAQMQDQLRTLQSTLDQRLAALQTLVQEALDAASKANTSVSVLNAGVTSTMERELKGALTPVAGLAAKVDNTNNDVAEVRNQVQDLNNSMNKVLQILTDINNNIKVMQSPPPPAPTSTGAPGAGSPPPAADALFSNGIRDESSGKYDLAIQDYSDFIRYYPDNPNAERAMYNIAQVHYTQQKFEQAAADCDAVIAKYPDDSIVTPQAYFMKGMALRGVNKTEAIGAWRTLIRKYPNSEESAKAKEQLRALNAPVAAPASTARKKR